jgi:hypothetical protein
MYCIRSTECVLFNALDRSYIMSLVRFFLLLLCFGLFSTLFLIIHFNEVQDDNLRINNHTNCLLDVYQAFDSLSIPWFLTFGTALMYWRSKNFISNDIDIGIFYEDLQANNFNERDFLFDMINIFDFKFRHRYGRIDHGQEWAFSCPKSRIPIDIFVFYHLVGSNHSSDYWTATYNDLCNKMIYKKCRWKFKKFNLSKFYIDEKRFYIVPLEFVIERYGKNYMIPKEYDYFQSLKILPNLIQEYRNNTNNIWWPKRNR